MYVLEMLHKRLHTPHDHSTHLTRVLPAPDVSLISMLDEQALREVSGAADVADVFGLSDVNALHMLLEVALEAELEVALVAAQLGLLGGRQLVDLGQVLLVEVDADLGVAVLASHLDVTFPDKKGDIQD